jgi:hypothetical protein
MIATTCAERNERPFVRVEWFNSLDHARETLARWRRHYNQLRPHSALADRTLAFSASAYVEATKSFAPMNTNTASCGPRQGFATPANDAALDPVPRLPENFQYRGEALFKIAHSIDSLLSLDNTLRQSRTGEP